jgi:hypothetical protein
MKKLAVALTALSAVALVAAPAHAQLPHLTPFSFEARAGFATPTGDFNDLASANYALSGSVTYHAVPMLGIYAGYSMNKFNTDADDGEITDNGVDLGARLGIPTPMIPIDPWIKAGVVLHHMELKNATLVDNFSDSGTGFEVGAGLGFGFGPVSITPGIGYVSYNVDAGGAADMKASYVKADIGVRIRI